MPASKKRKEGVGGRETEEKKERDCLAAKQQLRALRLLTDLYESKRGENEKEG